MSDADSFAGVEKSAERSLAGVSKNLPHILDARLDLLEPDPDQPRKTFYDQSIEELADSIKEQGLLQPILVRAHPEKVGHFYIVAGERRYRAFKMLERKSIPAFLTSGNHREISLVENLQREDLNPIDEAHALLSLYESHKYSQDMIAKAVGKKRTTINEIMRINDLPDYIKERCRTYDSPVPKRTLIEIARIQDPDAQRSFWEEVSSGSMKVRHVRALKRGVSELKPGASVRKVVSAAKVLMDRIESVSPAEVKEDSDAREKLLAMADEIELFFTEIR